MYKRALLLFVLLNIISVVFYACCEDVYRVKPKSFSVSFMQLTEEDRLVEKDSINGAFVYTLWAEVEDIGYNNGTLGIINSTYATSCEERYINKLVAATAKVVLDKSIKINGETFEAGGDLLDLDEVFTADIFNANVVESGIKIYFKTPFLERSEFEAGEYEFHATVETEEGDVIESKNVVYLSF